MFDRYNDALMAGHFRMAIDSQKLETGEYRASWTAPNGTVISHTDASQAEAHRRVTDAVRLAVMKGDLQLSR